LRTGNAGCTVPTVHAIGSVTTRRPDVPGRSLRAGHGRIRPGRAGGTLWTFRSGSARVSGFTGWSCRAGDRVGSDLLGLPAHSHLLQLLSGLSAGRARGHHALGQALSLVGGRVPLHGVDVPLLLGVASAEGGVHATGHGQETQDHDRDHEPAGQATFGLPMQAGDLDHLMRRH
jgi:hypothetical protein